MDHVDPAAWRLVVVTVALVAATRYIAKATDALVEENKALREEPHKSAAPSEGYRQIAEAALAAQREMNERSLEAHVRLIHYTMKTDGQDVTLVNLGPSSAQAIRVRLAWTNEHATFEGALSALLPDQQQFLRL